jgi:hypothetical protein
MNITLVTYADKNFNNSRKKLVEEAKNIGLFTRYFNFGPSDLPSEIKTSLFLKDKIGAGYWLWKPIIIKKAIELSNESDIIVYLDSGCKINRSNHWGFLFNILKNKEAIFFKYNSDIDYEWGYFGINSTKLGYWCHPQFKDYFNKKINNINWYELDKFMAGVIFIKKSKNNVIINKWYELALTEPKLFFDEVIETRISNDKFNSHRHDQSVLSILINLYSFCDNVEILNEYFELQSKICDSPILTERRKIVFKHKNFISKIFNLMKNVIVNNYNK